MELLVDYRWLLNRQEDVLHSDLTVNELSALVGMAARHRVNTPRLDQAGPAAFWRAAVFLEECVLLRPLPARNEAYGTASPSPTWRPPASAWTPRTSSGATSSTRFVPCSSTRTASRTDSGPYGSAEAAPAARLSLARGGVLFAVSAVRQASRRACPPR